jgi:uncharacterized damage-inducible protein DinB
MYRKIQDFLRDWEVESTSTVKVFERLTDESLGERIVGGRTLGRLAWHIAVTLQEMLERTGLEIDRGLTDDRQPANAAAMVRAYRRGAERVAAQVAASWTDDDLQEEVEMYGERWRKGQVLSVLIRHQCHHRGQMTVLMRQAGLTVPGVSGPSREEWATWGMQPME